MRIAILTFEGFNEIDSFVALNILGRVQRKDWQVAIACPEPSVRSANGVRVDAQQTLEFANEADAVVFGSGRFTQRIVETTDLASRLQLDPQRQLIASQCSGALMLAKLNLLPGGQACTDHATRPIAEAAGIEVLHQPFFCHRNVATAGGCLSSHYLAAWLIWRLIDRAAARAALEYVVPVGQEAQYIDRALGVVEPFIPQLAGGPVDF
jgi:transcriptional regulator GlxA family with amidase domain